MADRAHERIAAALRELGVDARPIDGWVYIQLAGDRGVLCISAEYGASLDTSHYPLTPTWFIQAPTDRQPAPAPYDGPPSVYEQFLRDHFRGSGG